MRPGHAWVGLLLVAGCGTTTIDSVEPSSGPARGGTQATLTGSGFDGISRVRFGEATAQIVSQSDERIVVLVPPGIAGPADVFAGDAALNGGFTYEALPAVFEPAAPAALPAAPVRGRTPVLADLDGDGDLDLFLAARGEASWALANDGLGSFGSFAGAVALPVADVIDAVAGDLDGDSDLDLYLATLDPGPDLVLWNDGLGRFTVADPSVTASVDDRTTGALLADLDGDGDLDVVTANWQASDTIPPGLRFLENQEGRLVDATAARLPADPTATFGVAALDADGDGDLDLVAARDGAAPRLLLNDGAGGFMPSLAGTTPQTALAGRTPAVLDADLDGDMDIALATTEGARLWLNDGAGSFRDATAELVGGPRGHVERVTAADLDRDGDTDLVLARWTAAGNVFLRNDGAGLFFDYRSNLGEPGDGTDAAFAAGDVDGDNDDDLVLSRDAAPPMLLLQTDGQSAIPMP